ncbi:hypothetical protein XENOCAPTIV_029906 [Xenoophorus captivus]|uniref:Uncharacterized protein n=1 Tax=Xenoophorus captivus TaxID=1517983 RepID=A0ABV0SCH3_9TELE
MKLENKVKNRQLKQQNVAKKQRKEQKRMRQAMKGAALQMPRPLETYRKRPAVTEVCLFSPSGPVHSSKKRSADVVRSYEKIPRKMAKMEEKELIQLLPIKDKSGVIPRCIERGSFHVTYPLIDFCDRLLTFLLCLSQAVKRHPNEVEEEEEEELTETPEQEDSGKKQSLLVRQKSVRTEFVRLMCLS